jgi:hypothetical protein
MILITHKITFSHILARMKNLVLNIIKEVFIRFLNSKFQPHDIYTQCNHRCRI